MVDLLCPHCEESLTLEDNVSGEFECPHCGGLFEWGIPNEYSPNDETNLRTFAGLFVWLLGKTSLGAALVIGVVMMVLSVSVFGLSSTIWDSSTSGTSEAAGAGVVVIMGIAAIGFLVSVVLGIYGLAITIFTIKKLSSG